jgi:hypothetical protein
MTASAAIDRRIDYNGTLANLIANIPTAGFPPGTWAWCTDFGFVEWTGTAWAMQTYATVAANVGGTQGTGTPIAAELNNVTAAGASYSVTLPASALGMFFTIHNISANTVLVFPNAGGTTTEKINAGASNASYSMLTLTSTTFTCAVLGQWYTVPRTAS